MDALFGLPRKKAAGVSHRPAVQGHLFFVEQSCVDEHVAGSKTHTLMKNVRPCSYILLHYTMYTYIRVCTCTCTYTFINICRTAVTFWLEMLYEVPQGIKHLTRLVCLDVPVVMSFQYYFWT